MLLLSLCFQREVASCSLCLCILYLLTSAVILGEVSQVSVYITVTVSEGRSDLHAVWFVAVGIVSLVHYREVVFI